MLILVFELLYIALEILFLIAPFGFVLWLYLKHPETFHALRGGMQPAQPGNGNNRNCADAAEVAVGIAAAIGYAVGILSVLSFVISMANTMAGL